MEKQAYRTERQSIHLIKHKSRHEHRDLPIQTKDNSNEEQRSLVNAVVEAHARHLILQLEFAALELNDGKIVGGGMCERFADFVFKRPVELLNFGKLSLHGHVGCLLGHMADMESVHLCELLSTRNRPVPDNPAGHGQIFLVKDFLWRSPWMCVRHRHGFRIATRHKRRRHERQPTGGLERASPTRDTFRR